MGCREPGWILEMEMFQKYNYVLSKCQREKDWKGWAEPQIMSPFLDHALNVRDMQERKEESEQYFPTKSTTGWLYGVGSQR